MPDMRWILLLEAAAMTAAIDNAHKLRTRFTFLQPTNENVLSILFRCDDLHPLPENGVKFNHRSVGITRPMLCNGADESHDVFPLCSGYPDQYPALPLILQTMSLAAASTIKDGEFYDFKNELDLEINATNVSKMQCTTGTSYHVTERNQSEYCHLRNLYILQMSNKHNLQLFQEKVC
mmetsp:Transcript_4951/g.10385  ORF Transcript_4951/g.10385 Transcript_4951/m.10385 type:complete len:178 (-) Transcript_4951:3404-3937(-)